MRRGLRDLVIRTVLGSSSSLVPSFAMVRMLVRLASGAHLLSFAILGLSCALAFLIRLFSVVQHEVIIHEYDPYFNYRSTEVFINQGFYAFHNWFDARSWYPLGRAVGSSIYPGLMVTAALVYHILHFFHVPVDVRQVCCMIGPLFSSFTVIATYALTMEATNGNKGAALLSAALVSIVPGYISRSVAGSYDNEAIAIFALVLTFALWLRAVRTGTMMNGALAALAYLYMVSSWGGYIFVTNLIPLHVALLIATQRFTRRTYVAYSTFYAIGTLLSMQISFVNFKPMTSSDHAPALGIFCLCQLLAFYHYIRSKMTTEGLRSLLLAAAVGAVTLVVLGATATGKMGPLAGRLRFFFDSKGAIPIVSSVAEHQPTPWAHYYYDLHILLLAFPAGLYHCFRNLHEGTIFMALYGLTTLYFTGVMIRIVLVLAPAACVLAAIGISAHFDTFMPNLWGADEGATEAKSKAEKKKTATDSTYAFKSEIAAVAVFLPIALLASFVSHSIYMAKHHYSDPTIVLSGGGPGGKVTFDDFREAYKWLSENTKDNDKVLSWWDYGYHLSSMANRTTYADGNTWNNTHISRVGQALASNETAGYEILRELDVNYVLVVFGGKLGFSGDDINKFLWMIRIAGSTPLGAHIKQEQYFTKHGEYRIDQHAAPTLRKSLMYKFCYHRFGALMTHPQAPMGYDLSQNQVVGDKAIVFDHFEEAYTSENWLIRVYRVKPPANRYSRR